jgi:5'-nucleotidase
MQNFYITNQTSFDSKIQKIKADGPSKLHVISDYDRTLTGNSGGGNTVATSWAIFVNKLGDEYTKARNELYNHYHPIEIDSSLDQSFKSEQVSEWFHKHLELMVKYGVTTNMISKSLEEGQITLRENAPVFLKILSQENIPLIIFSAAIGDVINVQLKSLNLNTENVHILSNFLKFDENGKAVGFQNDLVHPFNKTERLIGRLNFRDQIAKRPNCILLGDALYDATMADGMEHEVILKIGFLNGNKAEKENFSKVYDLLVEEDVGMGGVNELILNLIS